MKALLAALALVNATVHTGDGPPLEHATVVIDGPKIVAVGTALTPPATAERIDATGKVVTPGLFAVASRLGEVDAEAEPTSVEGTLAESADPVRAALRVADTYNPASFTLPIARAGGISEALVTPAGGLIAGQAALVGLGVHDGVRRASAALALSIPAASGGEDAQSPPGGRSAAFLRLRQVLADTKLYRASHGQFLDNRLRALSVSAADLEVLERAIEHDLPVLVQVDRRAEIQSVLALAHDYDLRIAVVGGAEAWQLAPELARAHVPVVFDPLRTLPDSFSALHARRDAAALLHAAGVPLVIAELSSPHFAHRLRWAAGNAVAEGLPYDAALAAVTSVPAELFGEPRSGVLRAGAPATLVLWNGDPLDVTTWAERMWVRGEEVSLETRQDLLTERYRHAR
ncbi:MAG TPA: amidohydrolase family protein [Myxococcota bacterium]|nr:amidohydrolase family protein [Myxococcota bacterium]